MPVLSKLHGIIIRILTDPSFGIHLHALYGESEMVLSLDPVRVVQSDAPEWVETWVLEWTHRNAASVLAMSKQDRRVLLQTTSSGETSQGAFETGGALGLNL